VLRCARKRLARLKPVLGLVVPEVAQEAEVPGAAELRAGLQQARDLATPCCSDPSLASSNDGAAMPAQLEDAAARVWPV
jgi:hypothetical protein